MPESEKNIQDELLDEVIASIPAADPSEAEMANAVARLQTRITARAMDASRTSDLPEQTNVSPSALELSPKSRNLNPWRILMQSRSGRAGLGLAAAIVITVGATLLWRPAGRDPNAAYVEAIQKLASARTATYTMTFENSATKFTRRVLTDPNGKVVVDDKHSEPATTTWKVMWMAPGKERQERSNGAVHIMDWTTCQSLMLQPSMKQAIVSSVSGRGTPHNIFDQVRTLQLYSAEKLGEQEIDGRKAVGFRTAKKGETGVQWTLWVDPATDLLIRIEAAGGMFGPGKQIMTDFAFDIPLDESLFSLTPPAGYEVIQQKSKEQHLTDGLKAYAEIMGGTLPDALPIAMAPAIKKYREVKPGATKEQVIEMQKALTGPMMFTAMLPKDSEWHYAGKGVALGTPGKIIFWYKTPLSKQYQVIYADLTTGELPAEALPKTQPAE